MVRAGATCGLYTVLRPTPIGYYPSDRQLIHWLCLGSDPQLKSFDLAPKQVISHDGNETRATELDAIVVFKDGRIQWHEVKAGTNQKEPSIQSQFNAQAAASKEHVEYKIINDTYLKPRVKVALRRIKPLGFADVIKKVNILHAM